MTLVADIVTLLVIVLVIGPLVWLALRWLDRRIRAMRARQMERAREKWAVEDNSGDQGATLVEPRHSRPSTYAKATVDKKAPETGSGLPDGRESNGYGNKED